MELDPETANPQDAYKLMIGSIVPRPIAFVSTVAEDGTYNLAPFSFFIGLCSDPPTLGVSVSHRGNRKKDTWSNAVYTGDFVVNVVTEEIAERMNVCSGEYGPQVDEFRESRLTPVPSVKVRAPRVAESPINMECRLQQVVEVGRGQRYGLLIGEVVYWHVRDDLVKDGKIDAAKLRPIGRLGGDLYTRSREIFEMIRPRYVTG